MRRGYAVTSVTRSSCHSPFGVKNVFIKQVDGFADFGSALSGISTVVHLAARVHVLNDSVADPLSAFREVNVSGTLNLARQAAALGVKRFVFISSIGVLGSDTFPGQFFTETSPVNPHGAYSRSKLEAERGLMDISTRTGLEVVIVRPPLVYGKGAPGNFEQLARAVRISMPLPLGSISNLRSFVSVCNLVDFIFACVSHPMAANEVFLVSDGEDVSTPSFVRMMAHASGFRALLVPFPVFMLGWISVFLGKKESFRSLSCNLRVDISKAKRLLGWSPPFSLQQSFEASLG